VKAHNCKRAVSEFDAFSAAYERHRREFNEASRRYLNDFMSTACAADLLAWRVFPNAKEVTESFAAYWGVVRYMEAYHRNDPAVKLVVVGDGVTPRTAATFAVRSKWDCYSVDPLTRGTPEGCRRVTAIKAKAEDMPEFIDCLGGPVVVVAVHSHAKLVHAVGVPTNYSRMGVLAMECCVPQRIPWAKCDMEYRDTGVWSPKNSIQIWRDLKSHAPATTSTYTG